MNVTLSLTAGSSREPSVKGGNAFLAGGGGGPGVDGPAPSPKDYSSSHGGMPRNSSASRLWAFGQGAGRSPTTSPPVSREASAHAGSELRGLGAMRLSVPGMSHGTTGSPAPLAIPGRSVSCRRDFFFLGTTGSPAPSPK